MNSAGSGSRSAPLARARSYSVTFGEIAGGAQQFLAPVHLTGQRVAHPVDHGQFVFEVGDDRRDVRGALEPEERRAALEVDEHQVERFRRMRGDHRQHQGAQELRLPRTRCADAQPVRTHAALGGLLDVEFERLTVGVMPIGTRSRSRGDRGRHTCSGTISAASGIFSNAISPGSTARESDSRLTMCAALAGRNRPMRRAVVSASAMRDRVGGGEPLDARRGARRRHRRRPPPTAGSRRAVAPSRGPLRSSTVTLSRPASVISRSSPVTNPSSRTTTSCLSPWVGWALRLNRPRSASSAASEVSSSSSVGNSSRIEPIPSRADGVLGVRQPLDPTPVLAVGVGGHHRDLHVIGSVKCAQLQHHRADQLLRQLAFALEGDGREGAQRHRGRQGVHHRMRLDEPAQRHRRHRFEVLGRAGLGGQQPGGQPVGADADAHMAVVRVGRPAFPHPAGADHVGQRARVGMAPLQRGALLRRRCRRPHRAGSAR